jgi:hypothetical protein
MRWTPVRIRDVSLRGTANPAIALRLQSEEQNNSWDDRLRGLHPVGRVAELGSLGMDQIWRD